MKVEDFAEMRWKAERKVLQSQWEMLLLLVIFKQLVWLNFNEMSWGHHRCVATKTVTQSERV